MGSVTRVLWLLALLTAFLVVAARLAGLPLAVAFAAEDPPDFAVQQLCQDERDEGVGDGASTPPVEVDDDQEQGSAPLMHLASVALKLPPDGESRGLLAGALVDQRALPSHAQSLDRPPRG